jgi:hypothetical protein
MVWLYVYLLACDALMSKFYTIDHVDPLLTSKSHSCFKVCQMVMSVVLDGLMALRKFLNDYAIIRAKVRLSQWKIPKPN